MKVLLAAHVGYPWGGISQRYSDLLHSSLPKRIGLAFFESSPNIQSFSASGNFSFLNLTNFVGMFAQFIRALLRERPSIVHIASAYGWSFYKHSLLILCAKGFGKKVILAPHCSLSVFVPKSRLPFQWMKFILNRCDGIIVLSSEWLRLSEITPLPRVILLKNSIDLAAYLRLERPSQLVNAAVKIIYLGHIGAEKGIFDLIEAVKILAGQQAPEFRVFVYGESLHPGELEQAQTLARQLQVEDWIHFCTPVFGNDKVNVFQNADIFVLPSHHEGLPISIIEAMASALPVVATNTGGIPDLVEDGKNGLLVHPHRPAELAYAMSYLIGNESLRRFYGRVGRRKAEEEHNVERYVDRLIPFYEEINGEHSPRRNPETNPSRFRPVQ